MSGVIPQILQYRSSEYILEQSLRLLNLAKPPKSLVPDMKKLCDTAATNGVATLAANQIGLSWRMFAVLSSDRILPGQWSEYQSVQGDDYRVILNPSLLEESQTKFKDLEECASVEGVLFAVWVAVIQYYRFSILKSSTTMQFESKKVEVRGFQARLWDHATRHLNGILPIRQEVSHLEFHMKEQYKVNPLFRAHFEVISQQMKFICQDQIKKHLLTKEELAKRKGIRSPQFPIPENITPQLQAQLLKMKQKYQKTVK